MAIILSQHLRTALDRKRLKMAYIEAAIAAPDWTLPDRRWIGVTVSFKAIPEFGHRIIRVAHRATEADVFVIADGSQEVSPGIMLHLDTEGRVTGIEIEAVSLRLAGTYGVPVKQDAAAE